MHKKSITQNRMRTMPRKDHIPLGFGEDLMERWWGATWEVFVVSGDGRKEPVMGRRRQMLLAAD